jgi:hypothetical protein
MLVIAMLMIQKTSKLVIMVRYMADWLTETTRSRHLLRLWLRDPQNSWVTPEPLGNRTDRIFDEAFQRGPQVFPLDPIARSVGKARKD